MYLLDTNIVSELRKPRPNPRVVHWIAQVPDAQLFISAVTIGEIQSGIEMTRDQDPDRARAIERWLDQVISTSQVIDLGADIWRRWGKLMHRKSNTLLEDALIAACALSRDLTVVTRNVSDFDAFGVTVINPFAL